MKKKSIAFHPDWSLCLCFRNEAAAGTQGRRHRGLHQRHPTGPEAEPVPLRANQLSHPERRGGGSVRLDERQLPQGILL